MNSERNKNRIAVFFPGIGYTCDKPLLYYARKLTAARGFEEKLIAYQDLPKKIRGDRQKLALTGEMAYAQVCEQLDVFNWTSYHEVLFVGKSIGTALAVRYAMEHHIPARMVLYTPLEVTFQVKNDEIPDAVAFLGGADPWSDYDTVVRLAAEHTVPLHTYPGCNHSLERPEDVEGNIRVLEEVMAITERYIDGSEK